MARQKKIDVVNDMIATSETPMSVSVEDVFRKMDYSDDLKSESPFRSLDQIFKADPRTEEKPDDHMSSSCGPNMPRPTSIVPPVTQIQHNGFSPYWAEAAPLLQSVQTPFPPTCSMIPTGFTFNPAAFQVGDAYRIEIIERISPEYKSYTGLLSKVTDTNLTFVVTTEDGNHAEITIKCDDMVSDMNDRFSKFIRIYHLH